MKHFYTIAAVAALFVSLGTAAQTVATGDAPQARAGHRAQVSVKVTDPAGLRASIRKAAADPIITAQPEGTPYKNLYRYSKGYFDYQGQMYGGEADGYTSDVVLAADGTFYLKDPLGLTPTQAWLKGHKDGDTIVVNLPQKIKETKSKNGTVSYSYAYKMNKEEFSLGGDDAIIYYTVAPDEEQQLKYVWRNDSIVKADTTALLGLCDESGNWLNSGELATVLTVVKEQPAVPEHPEAARDYALSYGVEDDSRDMKIVTATTEGNTFYMKGFYELMPDAWVKGRIEDGKVIFDGPQYLGVLDQAEAHVYFSPVLNDTVPDETGQLVVTATMLPSLEFKYDEAAGRLSTDGAFIVNVGKNIPNVLLDYAVISMEPWTETPATPKDPEIKTLRPYNDKDKFGYIGFKLDKTGTNDEKLNPQKLFYNIYFDDQIATLTPDEYRRLKEPMTDIPCNFTDYTDIFISGYMRVVYFFKSDLKKVGVRAFYTGGGETRYSNIVFSDGNKESGITSATAGDMKVVSEAYTDLSGRRVLPSQKGLLLKTTRYANGSVTTEKVLNR